MRHSLIPILILAAACGASKTSPPPAVTHTFVAGAGLVPAAAPDDGCKGKDTGTVDPATCTSSADASDAMVMGGDATSTGDSGAPEFGPTHAGSESDDDDCKYHVKWLATGATVTDDVYFQVDLTTKADGKPASHLVATARPLVAEVYVDNGDPAKNHGAPNSEPTSQETDVPGRYVLGPIRFDQPARWTVRFHIYPDCDDGDTSPHGHAAFFFDAK